MVETTAPDHRLNKKARLARIGRWVRVATVSRDDRIADRRQQSTKLYRPRSVAVLVGVAIKLRACPRYAVSVRYACLSVNTETNIGGDAHTCLSGPTTILLPLATAKAGLGDSIDTAAAARTAVLIAYSVSAVCAPHIVNPTGWSGRADLLNHR